MTRRDCANLQEENHRLAVTLKETQGSLEQAQTRITLLERANADIERRLRAYENPHTPPSKRTIYPKKRRLTQDRLSEDASEGKPRYPGRPGGHRGSTRPRRRPDVVVQPPRI
jgi:hypothetical protein